MSIKHLQSDLLYCRLCNRHFRGRSRICPTDGAPLELVTAFDGRIGDILDQRYELKAQIGAGGMGTVFRAHDTLTHRDVALKLLKTEYASNSTSAQRFLQEARLLRKVEHPGIVGLHRFGRTPDGTLLIDMELVDGEAVRDRVLRMGRGLDMQTALYVLDNLLAALAACHDAGVVHCDVKPENIMLPRAGSVGLCKLVDFGIAQVPGPIVQADEIGVVGTPAYMSPEQVRAGNIDARTDLYLVGCVTYELLTGEPPFAGATALDLCTSQLLDEAPTLASRLGAAQVPSGLEAWLKPLMAKSPDQRPTSARQVREGLRAIRTEMRKNLSDERMSSARLSSLRPPSSALLRRPRTPGRGVPAVRSQESGGDLQVVRALVEVSQIVGKGVTYGPEAIEQIARHVLAGTLDELRQAGADVSGPAGRHIEIRMPCAGDERGAVSHLLDTLASMHAQLARIPEPRLQARAAVVADRPAGCSTDVQGLDPLGLLDVSPGTQIRVDEYVARWAGRRALVRLTSVPSVWRLQPTDIYATSLHPV